MKQPIELEAHYKTNAPCSLGYQESRGYLFSLTAINFFLYSTFSVSTFGATTETKSSLAAEIKVNP